MNKEKEALLNKVLSEPDVPYKISHKSILSLLERMQPKSNEMRDYLFAYYSAETSAESEAFFKAKYASMTPLPTKAFEAEYLTCLENDMSYKKSTQSV